MLALLIASNSVKCINLKGISFITKSIAKNTNINSDFEVFKKNVVERFNDLKSNFFEEVYSFKNEL